MRMRDEDVLCAAAGTGLIRRQDGAGPVARAFGPPASDVVADMEQSNL